MQLQARLNLTLYHMNLKIRRRKNQQMHDKFMKTYTLLHYPRILSDVVIGFFTFNFTQTDVLPPS
jgi:hypothetical protein